MLSRDLLDVQITVDLNAQLDTCRLTWSGKNKHRREFFSACWAITANHTGCRTAPVASDHFRLTGGGGVFKTRFKERRFSAAAIAPRFLARAKSISGLRGKGFFIGKWGNIFVLSPSQTSRGRGARGASFFWAKRGRSCQRWHCLLW